MNILFLTIGRMNSIEFHGLYPDLLRQFRDQGHNIYVVSSQERRIEEKTHLVVDHGAKLLYVKIGNITKCNIIEKGISTLRIGSQYKVAIRKYFKDIKFDLILYSTPPITLVGVVEYIKKRDEAKTYLILKDIFPQNAVDLGIIKSRGIKGIIYKYFRRKEKNLYEISDRIGCMSPANCEYLVSHNPNISPHRIEVFPNCIDPVDMRVSDEERNAIRIRYDLPLDKKIFVYGGNLGKPQDVPFIVECLKASKTISDVYFVVAGSGTDRHYLEEYIESDKPSHVRLFGQLPKEEYDRMIACCDVGLIFLDHRFTIPNFPSRLLAYMQAGLPVLACTDKNTDIGKIIVEGKFGWWCESVYAKVFFQKIEEILSQNCRYMETMEFQFLIENYDVSKQYERILSLAADMQS